MKRRHSIKNTPEQQEIYDINTIVYDQEVSYKVAQTMILKINLQENQKKEEEEEEAEADVADTKLVKNNPHGEQNENNTQDDITLTPIIFIPLQEDVPQSVQKNISNNNYILYDIDHSTNTHINHEYCIQLTNDTPTKFSNESHLNNNDNNYTGSLYNHIWTIVPGSFSILALLLISYYLQQGIKILSLAKQTPIANTLIESTVVGTLTINTMVVRDTFYDNCIILPGEVLSNILSPIEAHTNIYDCLDCS